jgi:hypothetical protein
MQRIRDRHTTGVQLHRQVGQGGLERREEYNKRDVNTLSVVCCLLTNIFLHCN